jgi:hypothetical protein
MSRLTLSMKTSLKTYEQRFASCALRSTYNSSKQRMGDPMASHNASSIQMVEKDFSPPDNVFVCRPLSLLRVMSGSTCCLALASSIDTKMGCTYNNVKRSFAVVNLQVATELALREKPRKTLSCTDGKLASEDLPSALSIGKCQFQCLFEYISILFK